MTAKGAVGDNLFFDQKRGITQHPKSSFDERNAVEEARLKADEAATRKTQLAEQEKLHKMRLAQMAPPGSLGLPPLLEARRIKYMIPNGCFEFRPLYDRIFVYQPEEDLAVFIKGGVIEMTESTKMLRRQQAPKGVLIAAGLQALDNLRSHGVDLGHYIMLLRNAPFRVEADCIDGNYFYNMCLRDGDLLASKDLEDNIRAGHVRIERVEGENNTVTHVFRDADGKAWNPAQPFISDDC